MIYLLKGNLIKYKKYRKKNGRIYSNECTMDEFMSRKETGEIRYGIGYWISERRKLNRHSKDANIMMLDE